MTFGKYRTAIVITRAGRELYVAQSDHDAWLTDNMKHARRFMNYKTALAGAEQAHRTLALVGASRSIKVGEFDNA